MPFYEIAYETGRMSVANYADDDEAKRAIGEHNRRAVNGEAGGPIGHPAERIAAVYVYEDRHPDEFNADQTMSADVFEKEVLALIKERKDKNGVVSIQDMALETRGLSHPMIADADKKAPFESAYKLKEDRKLALDFLKEGE